MHTKSDEVTDDVADNVFRGGEAFWLRLWDVALEVCSGAKLFQSGTSFRVTEEVL